MHVCICVYNYVYMHMCICMSIACVYVYVHVCVYVYVHVCVYVYVHVCVCIIIIIIYYQISHLGTGVTQKEQACKGVTQNLNRTERKTIPLSPQATWILAKYHTW